MKKYLILGGVLNTLLGIFHLLFWNIFDWPNKIMCLSPENRGILEVLNIHVAVTILFFGYASLFQIKKMLEEKFGRIFIFFIAFFYFIRLINEFIFWPLNTATIVSTIILLILILLYFIPYVLLTRLDYEINREK